MYIWLQLVLLIDTARSVHSIMMVVNFQIVFVSPFEHHSNLLPWREIGAEAGDHVMFLNCISYCLTDIIYSVWLAAVCAF